MFVLFAEKRLVFTGSSDLLSDVVFFAKKVKYLLEQIILLSEIVWFAQQTKYSFWKYDFCVPDCVLL